jgi:integrase
MRGHIRRRGNKWVVIVDVGRDESGRRQQRWHSGYRTKKDAQAASVEILGRMQGGIYIEPSKETLAVFLREWLEGQRAHLRPSTWTSYAVNIRCHIIPQLGARRLQAVTAADLNVLYTDLLAGGRADGKGGLSRRSIRYCHTILRKALADAVKQNRLARNVADQADPPRGSDGNGKMRTWSAEELRGFLEHVRHDRLYGAWLLAASTGMRRGEVLGLHWRDLDLDAGRLAVTQALVAVHGGLSFSEPKTDKGRRSVALDPGTVTVLREHRRRQLEERLAWGSVWRDNGLVFCREDGSPVHPDGFTRRFEQHVRAAELPPIRLHDLRHTHATLALAAGVHPKVVQERLGHATISITLDTYSHAIPAMQEEAAAKVAELVGVR